MGSDHDGSAWRTESKLHHEGVCLSHWHTVIIRPWIRQWWHPCRSDGRGWGGRLIQRESEQSVWGCWRLSNEAVIYVGQWWQWLGFIWTPDIRTSVGPRGGTWERGQQQWPSTGVMDPGVRRAFLLVEDPGEGGRYWWPSTGCQYLSKVRRLSRWRGR